MLSKPKYKSVNALNLPSQKSKTKRKVGFYFYSINKLSSSFTFFSLYATLFWDSPINYVDLKKCLT